MASENPNASLKSAKIMGQNEREPLPFDSDNRPLSRCAMRFFCRLVLLPTAFATAVLAQETKIAAQAGPRDPDVAKILADISPARIEATVRKLVSFKTRHTLSSSADTTVGNAAARNWIKSELDRVSLESGGRLKVEFDAFKLPPTPPRLPQGAEIVNVVATLPGTMAGAKERVYVVSGHYDTIQVPAMLVADEPGPGANDDGSGTAAVMELARVMSKYQFESTLVFMTVGAEEQGLHGSRHWAERAKREGINVAAMFTNDIIGNTLREDGTHDRSHVRLFAEGVPMPAGVKPELTPETIAQMRAGGENDFPTRQLARFIQTVAARDVPQLPVKVIYRRDRTLRGGDHLPFLEAGFTAVRFTEAHEVYARQHQAVRVENGISYGDLPDFVDFAYIAEVARVNAATLTELACRPAVPRGVVYEGVLSNDTTLTWEASPEPDLAGYRIVWRATTAPQWEHAVDVPKAATRHTIKAISKDNVIFGVQAVDAAGHVSPAAYPLAPMRR